MAGEGGWDEAGAAGFGEKRLKNTLPLYGNKDSMNINSMILTNILGSPYFKEELIAYKTFHEVVDEIYYKVDHLEPWEKNSRKLAGQVGMCAGVRGVAAGGIVSTAFCLLFKLFTFKLTRKQVTAMMNHRDSPYIRGIGFMYVRYCQPPADFWDWFSPYFDDEEEIDLKAGGGYTITIGEMCRSMLSKLDWFGTLFPRLPVNVQKDLEAKLKQYKMESARQAGLEQENSSVVNGQDQVSQFKDEWGEAGRRAQEDTRSPPPNRGERRSRSIERRGRSRERRRSRSTERRRTRTRSRSVERRRRSRSPVERRGRRSRSPQQRRRSRSREERRQRRSRSRDRRRSRSRNGGGGDRRRSRSGSRERGRKGRVRSHSRDRRSRSRSRDRSRRHRSRSRERRR